MGADASAVGASEYDFETVVIHELGHALGLGHSGDFDSVMYPYLGSGEAKRDLTANDLLELGHEEETSEPEPFLAKPLGLSHSHSYSHANITVAAGPVRGHAEGVTASRRIVHGCVLCVGRLPQLPAFESRALVRLNSDHSYVSQTSLTTGLAVRSDLFRGSDSRRLTAESHDLLFSRLAAKRLRLANTDLSSNGDFNAEVSEDELNLDVWFTLLGEADQPQCRTSSR